MECFQLRLQLFLGRKRYWLGSVCWMGILFSIFMILSFSLAQSMLQAQTIITSLHDSIPVSPLFLAISLGLLLALIVFGGVHRISNVVSYMVPFIALGYIILALHK